MSKAFLFILLGVMLLFGGVYLYVQQQAIQKVPLTTTEIPRPTKPQIVSTTTAASKAADTLPKDWKTYTSSEYGFTISHPPDVTHDTMPEEERFYKHGPSQSSGTELYDGILLLIKSGNLSGKSFEQWIDEKYAVLKNDPVQPRMGEKKTVTIAGKQGISFTVSSLGDRTMIYLPKGNNQYLEISNGTVEPAESTQGFQKTVDQMLSSLTYK